MKNIEEKTIIVFGGKSTEHDISIITALQVYKMFCLNKKNVLLVYLDKLNDFYMGDNLDKFETYKDFNYKKMTNVFFDIKTGCICSRSGNKIKSLIKVKFVINCCHGGLGEDGRLTSLFESLNIPSSTGDYKSLSISMDKLLTKYACVSNEVKTMDFFCVNKFDFLKNEDLIFQQVEQFKFPVVVKPRSQGSSVGVGLGRDYNEFVKALNLAFKFDNDVLVERAVINKREFNCCCFKDGSNVICAKVDEPLLNGVLLTFDDKYLKGGDGTYYVKGHTDKNCFSNGMQNQKRNNDKNIPIEVKDYIIKQSKRLYNLIELNGIVRFDFLMDVDLGECYLCEINAIPGSLGYYFFDDNQLIDKVIEASLLYWNKKYSISVVDAPKIFKG